MWKKQGSLVFEGSDPSNSQRVMSALLHIQLQPQAEASQKILVLAAVKSG